MVQLPNTASGSNSFMLLKLGQTLINNNEEVL
jgi:hypothetical protein